MPKKPLKKFKDKEGEASVDVIEISACSEGIWGDKIIIEISDPTEKPKNTYFTLSIKYAEKFKEEYIAVSEEEIETLEEKYEDISITEIEEKINDVSGFIKVEVLLDLKKEENTKKRPGNTKQNLAGGADGLEDADFVGDEDNKKGLHAFDEVDDINIVAIPDKAGDPEVILGGLTYCKNRKDCFFIADSPYGLIPTDVVKFRKGTGGGYTGNAFNSSYGALYYPWVYINDPLTGKKKLVPPSGVVAGTYAYTDSYRGVHKAPAGISEGYLDSVVDIEKIVTKGEHNMLNPSQVNVIRSLPQGICIWGARTLSADFEWQYVKYEDCFYISKSL